MVTAPLLHSRGLILLFLFLLSPLAAPADPETEALLLLKKSFQNATGLQSWEPKSSACTGKGSWFGVFCSNGVVSNLHLGGMGLSGKIDVDALIKLRGLRSISLTNNSFSGPIPSFNRLGNLKAIYLSGNQFSGTIPSIFFSNMNSLKKVWLPNNAFTGPIPSSIANLTNLLELHLENNRFSGQIPAINIPTLKSFNVSNNALEGEVPATLKEFEAKSFLGNEGLCGEQVGKQCKDGEIADENSKSNSNSNSSSNSNLSSNLDSNSNSSPNPNSNSNSKSNYHRKVATAAVVVVLVLMALSGLAIVMKIKREKEFDKLKRDVGEEVVAVQVPEKKGKEGSAQKESVSSARKEATGKKAAAAPQLTIVNDEKGVFGLLELMKSAAEALGNGALGSSYKAVMANGFAVVVKRMKEMNRLANDGFEAELKRLGRLRHPNVLPPLAFHFRKEEKLLVYEYIPGGSLYFLLHEDHGPGREELNWLTRLRIIRGIARGMAYLHTELSSSELPHGNLKSSNILVDDDFEPLLIDYGFTPLVGPNHASQSMLAYGSPESIQHHHVSHKSDVYCVGIVILEIVTRKLPSQYNSNGNGAIDMVQYATSAVTEKREVELLDPEMLNSGGSRESMKQLLNLAIMCIEPSPDRRPSMQEIAQWIEEIAADERCDEYFQAATPRTPLRRSNFSASQSKGENSDQIVDGLGSPHQNGLGPNPT